MAWTGSETTRRLSFGAIVIPLCYELIGAVTGRINIVALFPTTGLLAK